MSHHEKLRHVRLHRARLHRAQHAQRAAPHHELGDQLAHLVQSVRHAKSVSRESDVSAARQRQR